MGNGTKQRSAATMSKMKGVSALNVYKKIAIVRRSTDALTYEDGDGNVKTVADLGKAASTSVSHHWFGCWKITTCRRTDTRKP